MDTTLTCEIFPRYDLRPLPDGEWEVANLKTSRVMKQFRRNGYLALNLTDYQGEPQSIYLSRLVLMALTNDTGKYAKHKDGNQDNNSPENLFWSETP
jgi:hypothetical protein